MATKTKTKRKPRSQRTKAAYLPGLEPPRIKAIDSAADVYYEVVRERMEVSERESDAKQALIAAMHENGQTSYETPDGLVVTLESKEGVKCKRKKDISLNGEAKE